MYLTRSTISSNKSAYETGFEKSFVNTVNALWFLPKEIRSFHIQRFRFRLIVLGLQGSSSGYSSYYRILLFLLLIIIVIGITLLVIKGDVGEVQKFLTKQYTNMVAFAQKKYQKLKSHVSWFKIANIIK